MSTIELAYFTQPRGEGDPAVTPHPSHRLMLRDAQEAERLGFDAAWVPDHFYMERPRKLEIFPDCWTLMTAIGVTTERIRVGSMVIATTFRHPARLAKMAGALQELTGGRLILGIGAGNQVHEHNAFDLGFERRIGRFKEYVPILDALLKGETVSVEGRYYTLREASLRTYVPPVPIWIASGGEQTIDLTARYASGWNAAGTGWDLAAFARKRDMLAQACRAAGRDFADMALSHLSFLGVATDEADARRQTEALADEWKTTPEGIAQRMLIGTPDQIAARMRAMVELGVTHFVCIVQLTPEPERYWERVELLAREVLPAVRAG